jgi:tetratricopeptide (TPR) repeat protein
MRRLVVLLLLVLAGCQERTRVDAPAAEQVPAGTVSPQLIAALEQAQSLHHRADELLRQGQTDAAIAEVARVLQVRFPAGAGEGDDVRLDARARLGTLYLKAGRLDEAERVVEEGLASASRDSFFLANLYNVRGELHEARAASLSDPEAAKAELRKAILAYGHGQEINVRVQARVYQEAMP